MTQDLLPLLASDECLTGGVGFEAAMVAKKSRQTGLIPTLDEQEGLSRDEVNHVMKEWFQGTHEIAEEQRKCEVAAFAARGWPFHWLSYKSNEMVGGVLEEAVNVVERYFPAIAMRGLDRDEDMGLLQSKGFGGAEGVQAKRDPYGTLVLVSVHCVTGPCNFDVSTGDVEFEQGSRSHVLHLVYESLPSLEVLVGDVAAHPLIVSNENCKDLRHCVWMGEGWTGRYETRPRVHRPWNTLSAQECAALQLHG